MNLYFNYIVEINKILQYLFKSTDQRIPTQCDKKIPRHT